MVNVSDSAWGSFKESDYTLDQWKRACLISPPEPSEAKADYKFPVREPSGTLNKNACHAAAAALAGARGGTTASADQQRSAAKKLLNLYRNQLKEEPPKSLLRLAGEAVQMSKDTERFLQHYGVKGMRWGVRKDRPSGVSSRTNRYAKKDATEFARAKVFYGEGAGNRRKLIKARVEGRSRKDQKYKEAFDFHLERQDSEANAARAVRERRRKNVASSTARTARGVKNVLLRNGAPVTVAAAVIGAAALNPTVRSFVTTQGRTAYSAVQSRLQEEALRRTLRRSGINI